MIKLRISSEQAKQVIDITNRINQLLDDTFADVDSGICTLFVCHTTAALTTTDLDPEIPVDMFDAFNPTLTPARYMNTVNACKSSAYWIYKSGACM